MGQVIRVKCNSCNYEKRLYIGGGLEDCNYDVIIDGLSEKQKEDVNTAKELGADKFSINRFPAICLSCGNYYSVNKIKYTFKGKEENIYSPCPECSSEERSIIDINKTRNLNCPDCKGKITINNIALWD